MAHRPRKYTNSLTEPGLSKPSRGGGDLFLWTIIILLLIGLAVACWIGSFYIFGHPESPVGYGILTRLKKLDAPKRFELTAAPRGEFLSPEKLIEKYGQMTPRELERESGRLARNFIRNYKLSPDLVPYVVGDYNILDSYELGDGDYFPSGVVVLAEAKENPKVLLEHVFTASAKVVPVLQRTLLTGLDLQLSRGLDLSALVNVRRLEDGRLQLTAVPILYGNYASTGGPGSFSLEPPPLLNIAAGLPVIKFQSVEEATKKLATHRKRAGIQPGTPTSAGTPTPAYPTRPSAQLVRVQRPEAADGAPLPAPEPTPLPVATPLPLVEPPPVAAEVEPTPLPEADAPPAPPTPTPVPTPTPASIASTAGGTWPVYDAGQMPRGRLIAPQDVPELASKGGTDGERMYLQGSFVVTASGPNRAALRTQGGVGGALGFKGRSANVRIIVEYPSGVHPPSEGATFSRDSRRPFQITEIREAADGQINVWVREVTR